MVRLIILWFAALIAASAFADPRTEADEAYIRKRWAAERETEAKLAQIVDVSFVDASLGDAARRLADEHGLQIEINTRSLHDFGISVDDTFTLVAEQIPLREVLRIVLQEKILDLDYRIDGPILEIVNNDSSLYDQSTRVYDVSAYVSKRPDDALARNRCESEMVHEQLVPSPSCFSIDDPAEVAEARGTAEKAGAAQPVCQRPAAADPAARATDAYDFDSLVETIMTVVTPRSWVPVGGDATARPLVIGDRLVLVVDHSRRGHEELVELLLRLGDALE